MVFKRDDIDFGDYVEIEQKRYGVENEMYIYKVIGYLKSNSYVDVPVEGVREERLHPKVVDVIACVCCGISERDIYRYKKSDVKLIKKGGNLNE